MKIRVDVADLKTGMYVAELDRPWLESPFLFQGFSLDTQADIDQVRQVCKFVLIELEQSAPDIRPHLQTLQSRGSSEPTVRMGNAHTEKSGGGAYNFHEALQHAAKINERSRLLLLDTLARIKQGKRIDLQLAREIVSDTAGNLLYNHNAMLWLTYLKQRDEYTMTHCINVSILAMNFARHLQLDRSMIELIGLGALLHDLGKARIPDAVLNKPGRLTPEEFSIMKTHPLAGHRLLTEHDDLPAEVLDIVLHHHERISGRGYPDALSASQIIRPTMIAAIVDVYDAITSDRCYHDGMSPYTALQSIYKWTADDFDKQLVEEFISCMGLYPVGSLVELNAGQVGVVISTTPKTRLRPIVLLLLDRSKQALAQRTILNLATQEWQAGTQRLEITRVLDPKQLDIDIKQIIKQESLAT